MDYGERTTGTRDEQYNLISVLYHALHGAENCDRYAADAEVAGDERLAAFFRETQVMHTQMAERAKGLLGILELPPEFGVQPPSLDYPANEVPPTTDVPRTPPDGGRKLGDQRSRSSEYHPQGKSVPGAGRGILTLGASARS